MGLNTVKSLKQRQKPNSDAKALEAKTWSSTLWGISWTTLLPKMITADIRVDYLRHSEAVPVMQKLFPEVFEGNVGTNNARFFDGTNPAMKQKYYELAGDYFVFRDCSQGERVVGMVACTFQDWATYNMRNVSVHPDYQQLGIYQEFYLLLCEILTEHGVSRIEGDIAPTNLHHMAVLSKMGYIPTAMSVSERWGALVHVTKYLQEEEEDRFADLFSSTSATNKSANRNFRKKTRAAS